MYYSDFENKIGSVMDFLLKNLILSSTNKDFVLEASGIVFMLSLSCIYLAFKTKPHFYLWLFTKQTKYINYL